MSLKTLATTMLILLTICAEFAHARSSARASDETVAQAVYLALELPVEKLKGAGKAHCYPLFSPTLNRTSNTDSLAARGKNYEEAMTRSQLLCIKQNCSELPEAVNQEAARLAHDRTALRQILKATNATDAEIEEIEKHIDSGANVSTSTGGNCRLNPDAGLAAYSMCVSTPYTCD